MPGLTASVKMSGFSLIILTLKSQGMNYLKGIISYNSLLNRMSIQDW